MKKQNATIGYQIEPMSHAHADSILDWNYPGEYAIYNFERSQDCLAELMNGDYYACLDTGGTLVGYFCFGESARIPTNEPAVSTPGRMDIGLGLAPRFCGRGLGFGFVAAGIAYAHTRWPDVGLRLSVAAFNSRAIHLYQIVGFCTSGQVTHRRSQAPFYMMELGE